MTEEYNEKFARTHASLKNKSLVKLAFLPLPDSEFLDILLSLLRPSKEAKYGRFGA